MTISSVYLPEEFLPTESPFNFNFEFLELDDITVVAVLSDSSLAIVGVGQYLVTGNAKLDRKFQGGEVTLTGTFPAGTVSVSIGRSTDLDQLIDYLTYGAFPANTTEFTIDKLTMIDQEQDALIAYLLSNPFGGSGGPVVGDFIPLAGTKSGFPVTGSIVFQSSDGVPVYTLQSDILGPDTFGFVTERPGTGFIIATQDVGGVVQGFSFDSDGSFTLPSNSGNNQEAWSMGATSILGDPDVLVLAPINALGDVTTHPIAFVVSPTYTFVMDTRGILVAPRSTVAGDPDTALVTKDYAESLLPPDGGEANTASSPAVSGTGLTMAKAGIDLPFKKLIAGTDMVITDNGDSLTLDAGAGDGLPAGLIDQTLRNDAGTNTYSATGGLLVTAEGNVSIGPGALPPASPLQVHGDVAVRDGGALALNTPSNAAAALIYATDTNRLEVVSPAGGGVDIIGGSSVGAAVKLRANNQDVFIANGDIKSWAQILHANTEVRYRTTDVGSNLNGRLLINNLAGTTNYITVADDGQTTFLQTAHFPGGIEADGGIIGSDAAFSGVLGVTGRASCTFDTNLGGVDTLTRKDYVDTKLDGKADTNNTVLTTGDQTIAGSKTFTGTILADGGISASGGILGVDAVFSGDVAVNTMLTAKELTMNGGINMNNSFRVYNNAEPTISHHAATKNYVDTKAVLLTGSSMSGSLVVGGNLSNSTLSSDGPVYSAFGTLTNTNPSDRNLKHDIEDLPYGLNHVCNLMPRRFKYNSGDGSYSYGFIAQEMAEVMPDFVVQDGDHLGIRGDLVPMLVKAIQELTARVAELEAR